MSKPERNLSDLPLMGLEFGPLCPKQVNGVPEIGPECLQRACRVLH
jgi:hypothetical protein